MVGIAVSLATLTAVATVTNAPADQYELAKHCYYAGRFVSSVTFKEDADAPDNKIFGRQVMNAYLPVIAFEGHHKGLTKEEISEDINAGYRAFSAQSLDKMNDGSRANQARSYNEIVDHAAACAEVGMLSLGSEVS